MPHVSQRRKRAEEMWSDVDEEDGPSFNHEVLRSRRRLDFSSVQASPVLSRRTPTPPQSEPQVAPTPPPDHPRPGRQRLRDPPLDPRTAEEAFVADYNNAALVTDNSKPKFYLDSFVIFDPSQNHLSLSLSLLEDPLDRSNFHASGLVRPIPTDTLDESAFDDDDNEEEQEEAVLVYLSCILSFESDINSNP